MSDAASYTSSVTVLATDFNGSTFDGFPFSASPPWLKEAIEANQIRIIAADRDYALFDVDTADGVVRTEPGDKIEYRPTLGLFVMRRGEWYKVKPRGQPEGEDT